MDALGLFLKEIQACHTNLSRTQNGLLWISCKVTRQGPPSLVKATSQSWCQILLHRNQEIWDHGFHVISIRNKRYVSTNVHKGSWIASVWLNSCSPLAMAVQSSSVGRSYTRGSSGSTSRNIHIRTLVDQKSIRVIIVTTCFILFVVWPVFTMVWYSSSNR